MPKSNKIIVSANNLKQEIIFSSDDMRSDLIEALMNKIMQLTLLNPLAVDLINNVSLKGPIHVEFLPEKPGHSPAWWDMNNNTIYIRCNLNKPLKVETFKKTFYAFLFEMANAANSFFQKGTKESKLVNISAHQNEESYARMMELAEYTTCSMLFDVYSFAKDNALWKTKEVGLIKRMKGFDKHWHDVNKKQKGMRVSHADHYRKSFRRMHEIIRELTARLELNEQHLQLNETNSNATNSSMTSADESSILSSSDSMTQDSFDDNLSSYENMQELFAALERHQRQREACKLGLAEIKSKTQALKVELECNKQTLQLLQEELENDFNSLQTSLGFFAPSNHTNSSTTQKSIVSQDEPGISASASLG